MSNHVNSNAMSPSRSLIIGLFVLLMGCNPASNTTPQQSISLHQTNAFRSVIDGKPRMLTLDLGGDVKAAYDTSNGTLYKVWKGELVLSGAVFDTKHGPQPEASGILFFEDESGHWDDTSSPVGYAGYEFEGQRNQTSMLYRAKNPDSSVQIKEQLEYTFQDESLLLTRLFVVSGLAKDDSVAMFDLPYNDMTKVAGDGAFEQGVLILKNGETRIQTLLTPQAAKSKSAPMEQLHPGLVLINNSDCAACHNPTEQTVGPSYQAIATRYANTEEELQRLSNKIIQGGAGSWGQIPMTPHADLSEDDAKTMLNYIFSLQQTTDLELQGDDSLMLGVSAVPLNLQSVTPQHAENSPGAYVYLYVFDAQNGPSIENIKEGTPQFGGLAKQIHLPNVDAFGPFQEQIGLRINTHLNIEKPLTTTLRLISDDGSYLFLNTELLIDNGGYHASTAVDKEITLDAGLHPIEIIFMQGGGGASLSLQWLNPESGKFEVMPSTMLLATQEDVRDVVEAGENIVKTIAGDKFEVSGVHPAFDLHQARPEDFEPMVGGIDFLEDGRMVVSTWDSEGSIYLVNNYAEPQNVTVKRIAKGLAEPLGVKVVDGDIYVMQKQELTRLVDTDGDDIIDRYEMVANQWSATENFHEFAFGLAYQDGYFYATLATAILPGGASANPQAPDRGKAMRISKSDGSIEFIAHGLRTPNGIGRGVDNQLFIADNQGDWLPASKIVELTEGAFYGSRSVDFAGTADLDEVQPVVWLPQNEIGNSPSEPAPLNVGPYQNQMIHGEVTHGGIKRVFAERVDGRLQGAVFRFSQGLEAGVNRLVWDANGDLIVGGVGNPGNWSHVGRGWFGLQRLRYNNTSVFEMLSVSARSDGFEITFTEPLKQGQNVSAKDFEISQWYYLPTEKYGGPKLDKAPLAVTAFSLSEDRTRAQFKLAGLKAGHVVYFRIVNPFISEDNHSLWSTEAWYTLNALPKNKAVEINPNYLVMHNQLSEIEKTAGWQRLFDGESLSGLRNYNQQTLGKRWIVDEGALHLLGRQEHEQGWQSAEGGDLVLTPEPLENYELYLEWKIQKNGNSGIIYNVKETPELEFPFLSGPEYQILDNMGHPDGRIEKHRAGDNYDLIETAFVTVNSPGLWNRTRLVVNKGHVEHWLNGYKVVDVEMFTPKWQALINESKFKDWADFAKSPGGHIVLQDHGDKVWYRNIKIKPLVTKD